MNAYIYVSLHGMCYDMHKHLWGDVLHMAKHVTFMTLILFVAIVCSTHYRNWTANENSLWPNSNCQANRQLLFYSQNPLKCEFRIFTTIKLSACTNSALKFHTHCHRTLPLTWVYRKLLSATYMITIKMMARYIHRSWANTSTKKSVFPVTGFFAISEHHPEESNGE